MRKLFLTLCCGLLTALPAALFLSCGDGDETDNGNVVTRTVEPPPGAPPVTRPSGAGPQGEDYEAVRTLESADFALMLGFAPIPDRENEAVMVTQDGFIWRVALDDSFSPDLFADVSGLIPEDPGFEEGLLGLAFSPNFPTDRQVFLYYVSAGPRRDILSRFTAAGTVLDVASEQVLLEIPDPFANHNGGQLTFGPDGYLYLSLGDGGSAGDPFGNGQNLGTLLGSIIRIEITPEGYAIPRDNPFIDVEGARPEIYAYGLRNAWRFSFDRLTGAMWAADVGQSKWEEVDFITAGGNYGWNIVEGPECFQAPGCDMQGLIPPRAAYSHELGCSVTGGYVYRGASMPELDGWYVYGDFCSGRIWALNPADGSDPAMLVESDLPITSFAELSDGELLIITRANAIYRLQHK
jgi:glucose/arabinose dehydrogenase